MSNAEIRIAIVGAAGRMGRQLIQATEQAEGRVWAQPLSVLAHRWLALMQVNWRAVAHWVSRSATIWMPWLMTSTY